MSKMRSNADLRSPIYLFLLILATPLASQPAWATAVPEIERVENQTLYFAKPAEGEKPRPPFKTSVYEIEVIGAIPRPASGPGDATGAYYIVSGLPKSSSPARDRMIYLVSPDDPKAHAFVYPGKILDPKSRELLYESRAYYGKCTNDGRVGYIVFQRERVDRRRGLQSSVMVASPGATFLEEKLYERRLPSHDYTKKRANPKAKDRSCFEVEGRSRLMTTERVNLKVPSDGDEDAAEDDTPTKENETNKELPPKQE